MPTNEALGAFLRSRRDRLKPWDLGLPATRRRRTPGLRREEVADAAGISAEWYVKLEQGRAVAPSIATIDALAGALRLDDVEHAHLRRLALGGDPPAASPEAVPDVLARLVESFRHPAYVTGRRWDLLAWNAAAADVFVDFGRLAPRDRNILLYVLTDPAAKALFGESWAQEARRMVALFRATHDLWAGDPAFAEIVERADRGCGQFRSWWTMHDVRAAVSGRKMLHHPSRGLLRYEYATFQANDDPALKLAVYVPF